MCAAGRPNIGKTPAERGCTGSMSENRHEEALSRDSTHKSRVAEAPPDVRHEQATVSRQASGSDMHATHQGSAGPPADMRHRQTDEGQQESGTDAQPHGGTCEKQTPDISLDIGCMEESAAWQPYVRKAGVMSMDLDAICMPSR